MLVLVQGARLAWTLLVGIFVSRQGTDMASVPALVIFPHALDPLDHVPALP